MTALLDLRDVRVRYQTSSGPLYAVDGVDLTIEKGETLGLVGESGCGKSTLARAIMGLLPEGGAATGTFDFDGRNLLTQSREQMRRLRGEEISLIFQEPMTRLDPLLRIEDHFLQMMEAHASKRDAGDAKRQIREALSSMGIPPNRTRQYPHEFSGGMRQRIMIALGIVLRPRLVIADEPTTALDVLVEAQILEIFKHLTADEDVSVLLITHNLGIVAETCERVAVMYAGKIIEVGPVEEVFARPKHPYTEGLLASVIHLESERLQSIAGSPPDLLDPPAACRFHPRCPYVMPICSQIEPPPVMSDQTRVACWLHGPADQLAEAQ